MEKKRIQKLLKKTDKPKNLSLKLHSSYKGKIEIQPKVPIKKMEDFSIWYTPGVSEVCKYIHQKKENVYDLTNKWNFVAVISDGTRVLGLGDIGPEAALPVMEGKALLFKYLGGVDAFPICLKNKNAEEIINITKSLTPTFGGINLEDIENPKCFYILEELKKVLDIPVWHDDQQGTATVTLAALINALKIVGKKISDVNIALVGMGAANVNVAKYIMLSGAKPENIVMVDSKGILSSERDGMDKEYVKGKISNKTNLEGKKGGIREALKGSDVCIAYSRPGPGVIKKEWISEMERDSIIIAGANPVPEIWPWEAKEAGAKIICTGRSDFPNQVNNSLGFPAIFRGALDVMALKITDDMCLAASYSIANYAEKKGLNEDYIIPDMFDTEMYIEESVDVGIKAIEQGVALKKLSRDELRKKCSFIINRAQKTMKTLIKNKIIIPYSE